MVGIFRATCTETSCSCFLVFIQSSSLETVDQEPQATRWLSHPHPATVVPSGKILMFFESYKTIFSILSLWPENLI